LIYGMLLIVVVLVLPGGVMSLFGRLRRLLAGASQRRRSRVS